MNKLFLFKLVLSLTLTGFSSLAYSKNTPVTKDIKWNVPTNKKGDTAEFAKIKFFKNAFLEFRSSNGKVSKCNGVLDGEKFQIITASHCFIDKIKSVHLILGEVIVKKPNNKSVSVGQLEARFNSQSNNLTEFKRYAPINETVFFLKYLKNNFNGNKTLEEVMPTVEDNFKKIKKLKNLDIKGLRKSKTKIREFVGLIDTIKSNSNTPDIAKIALPKDRIKFYLLPYWRKKRVKIKDRFENIIFNDIYRKKIKLRQSPTYSECKNGISVKIEVNPIFAKRHLNHIKKISKNFLAFPKLSTEDNYAVNLQIPIVQMSSSNRQFVRGSSGTGVFDKNNILTAIVLQADDSETIGYAITFTPEILDFLS